MENRKVILRRLRAEDEQSFRRAVKEFREKEPDWPFAFHFEDSTRFGDYLRLLDSWAKGLELPGEFVPNTFLVGVAAGRIIGRVSIRHEFNDYLSKYGGHAGYGVLPSERGRGYATRMLELAVPVAAGLGISRMLVTCDEENAASQRVIEKNGGVLENLLLEPDTGVYKKRYWITTATVR